MATNDPLANVQNVIEVAIRDGFQNASTAAIRTTTSKLFQGMLTAIRKDVGTRKSMKKVNQDLSYEMRVAVLDSYQQRVVRRKEYPSYRIGQNRLSGGVLLRALRKPAMFDADAFGVSYGNIDMLDKEAAHWRRLQFGAGAKANSLFTNRAVRVKLGRQIGTIRLAGEPSPGFSMPFGVWEKGRKGRPAGFYPMRRELVLPTEGIAGRHFMDAGARKFGKLFPPAYERLVTQYVDEAIDKNKGPLTKGKVPVQIALDIRASLG